MRWRNQRHIFPLYFCLAEALLCQSEEFHPIDRKRWYFFDLYSWLTILVLIIEGVSLFLLLACKLFDINFATLFISQRGKLFLEIISSSTIIMNSFDLELLLLGCKFHFWFSNFAANYGGVILLVFKILQFERFFTVDSLFANILRRRFLEIQDWLIQIHLEGSLS